VAHPKKLSIWWSVVALLELVVWVAVAVLVVFVLPQAFLLLLVQITQSLLAVGEQEEQQNALLEHQARLQFLALLHPLVVVLVEARRLVAALLAVQAAVKKVALQPVALQEIRLLLLHRKVARAAAVIVLALVAVAAAQVLWAEMPQCLY
jgi:hypothetical protein